MIINVKLKVIVGYVLYLGKIQEHRIMSQTNMRMVLMDLSSLCRPINMERECILLFLNPVLLHMMRPVVILHHPFDYDNCSKNQKLQTKLCTKFFNEIFLSRM